MSVALRRCQWAQHINFHPHSLAGYCLRNPSWSSRCSQKVHGSIPVLMLLCLCGVSFPPLLAPYPSFKNRFRCLLGETGAIWHELRSAPPETSGQLMAELLLAWHLILGLENSLQTPIKEPRETLRSLPCFLLELNSKCLCCYIIRCVYIISSSRYRLASWRETCLIHLFSPPPSCSSLNEMSVQSLWTFLFRFS